MYLKISNVQIAKYFEQKAPNYPCPSIIPRNKNSTLFNNELTVFDIFYSYEIKQSYYSSLPPTFILQLSPESNSVYSLEPSASNSYLQFNFLYL